MRLSLVLGLSLMSIASSAAAQDENGCKPGLYEIREKAEDGSSIRLEFGSLWAIDRKEWADTRVWLRLERVQICKGGLKKENSQRVVKGVRVQ